MMAYVLFFKYRRNGIAIRSFFSSVLGFRHKLWELPQEQLKKLGFEPGEDLIQLDDSDAKVSEESAKIEELESELTKERHTIALLRSMREEENQHLEQIIEQLVEDKNKLNTLLRPNMRKQRT